jgi:hypothetical protein
MAETEVKAPFRPDLLLKAASWAAHRHTPPALKHWQEDIAADAVLRAMEDRARGHTPNQSFFRHYVWHAVRHLAAQFRREQLEIPWKPAEHRTHELGPIALWRLQKVYPELTERQQLGLYVYISGGDVVATARSMGLRNHTDLNRGLKRALERIDEPGRFKKSARVYSRGLPDGPVSPDEVAAFKERDKLKARARRRDKSRDKQRAAQ